MPTTLPLARTNAEAHLFMDLQPCPTCGQTRCRYRSAVVRVDGVLASRYTGECPRCGTTRSYEFRLPEQIAPPSREVSFGGDQPSELIDPGLWLRYADDLGRRVPDDPTRLEPAQHSAARRTVATALAAIEETLKFIPPDADEVPAAAFATPEGRAIRDREPGRFRRDRLEAVRDYYAAAVTRW